MLSSNQVSGAFLKNGGTLMVTVVILSSTVLLAMVLMHGKMTVIAEIFFFEP